MTAPRHLPKLEPRGLRHEDAAAYVGLGTTRFDELVAEGAMPKPVKIGRISIWDRKQLDFALDALFDVEDKNPWAA